MVSKSFETALAAHGVDIRFLSVPNVVRAFRLAIVTAIYDAEPTVRDSPFLTVLEMDVKGTNSVVVADYWKVLHNLSKQNIHTDLFIPYVILTRLVFAGYDDSIAKVLEDAAEEIDFRTKSTGALTRIVNHANEILASLPSGQEIVQ